MTRNFVVCLLTLGDPARLTGGYLYHLRMAEAASRHGARVEFLAVRDAAFPLPAIDVPRELRRARRLGARVLVLDSIAAAFAGVCAPLLAAGPPVVAMVHQRPGGIDHAPLRTVVQARLDRLAYARARRILVASDALVDELAADGIHRARMIVVPPGRDVGTPAADDRPDLRIGGRTALLCVSNWLPRKGILELLDAVARLPVAAAVLHLVGDDAADPAYAARVRERLRAADLADRVVVHGPVSRDRVAGFYAAADVFVLASFVEPYGTVYGEAMAFALPVVGWRAGNLPHLAEHEREGLMAPPGDLDALAFQLRRLVESPSLRHELGAAGRARALLRPTWGESAARFFGVLREVAEERAAR